MKPDEAAPFELPPRARLWPLGNAAVGFLVFVVALATLMLASRTQGNTRDEGYYFDAAELYSGWYAELGENLAHARPLKSFTRESVGRWFSYNHEHPALMKTLFGLSWRVLHKCNCPAQSGRHPLAYPRKHVTLGLLDEQAAMRLPAHVAMALMAELLFLFGAALWSRRAGLVAAALAILAPRLFFDAQIAAMWVATVYAYVRSLQDPKWGWRAGVIFGLALATKHNAFFLPFVLVAHQLWCQRGTLLAGKLPSVPRALVYMATIGPLVYLACWPWLWFDTVARFREYVAFHVHHVYYNMEYLGHNYNKPPFPISFPYVMTLLTVPVTTLALAVGGVSLFARDWLCSGRWKNSSGIGFLIGLNALFPMAILTLTRAPIFGATKHWHATIPFLALLAAFGFERLTRALAPWLDERRLARVSAALAVLVALPAAAETWRSHPYGLSHYNLLAGGPAGGADLGMNRQFWGYATRGLLPWINDQARFGAPIYWHDTNQAQLNMDVREKLLRADVQNTGLEEPGVKASDIALVIHEKHFNKYEYWIWDFYGTAQPKVVLDDEGVPLVTLYERR